MNSVRLRCEFTLHAPVGYDVNHVTRLKSPLNIGFETEEGQVAAESGSVVQSARGAAISGA